MKVKDLMKFLKGCNPNAEVVTKIYWGCGDALTKVDTAYEIPKGQAFPKDVAWTSDNTYKSAKNSAKRDVVYLEF